jgi:hypothetical protein
MKPLKEFLVRTLFDVDMGGCMTFLIEFSYGGEKKYHVQALFLIKKTVF